MSNARTIRTTKVPKFADPVIRNTNMVHTIINRVIPTSPTFLIKNFSVIIKKVRRPIGITAILIFIFRGCG